MAKYSISCGGTGGHVFPGMATGAALQKQGHEVALWLSGKAIESAIRNDWTGQVVNLDATKISTRPLHLPRTILALARVYRASVKNLHAQRPDALLAMGSYSSLGPVLAAKRLNIPVILHEANVIPGKAISLLSHFATAVAITFPETRDHIRHHNIVRVGLPLRKTMEDAAISTKASPTPFVVLTMGGSQGAQRLNEMVPKALGIIRQEGHSITAIHLAGEKSKEQVESAYREANVPATVHGFCSDMVSIYQNTSLAISRSGANSCLELALFGIPSILVPLPTSARDHQKANARAMEKAGAATLIEQAGLSPVLLAQTIRAIMTSPDTLERMRNHAKARASTGAAESLADLIVKVGGSR